MIAATTSDMFVRLTREAWLRARDAYRSRMRPWVESRLRRRSRHDQHPVHDFLFEYYSFRPAQLLRWSPGPDAVLEDAFPNDLGWAEFVSCNGGIVLPASAFPTQRLPYLRWAIAYLEATLARKPAFGCFGMHEWAMVYRDPNVRHRNVPLRLTRAETDAVVEGLPLACTHFDAFRFFSAAAVRSARHFKPSGSSGWRVNPCKLFRQFVALAKTGQYSRWGRPGGAAHGGRATTGQDSLHEGSHLCCVTL